MSPSRRTELPIDELNAGQPQRESNFVDELNLMSSKMYDFYFSPISLTDIILDHIQRICKFPSHNVCCILQCLGIPYLSDVKFGTLLVSIVFSIPRQIVSKLKIFVVDNWKWAVLKDMFSLKLKISKILIDSLVTSDILPKILKLLRNMISDDLKRCYD